MQPISQQPPAPKRQTRLMGLGEVLFSNGDPPGAMYIVLTVRWLGYRQNQADPKKVDELGQLGPGTLVGGLAMLLSQPRSASVRALEMSTVLEIPLNELGDVTKQYTPVIRVIVDALHNRAGLPMNDI